MIVHEVRPEVGAPYVVVWLTREEVMERFLFDPEPHQLEIKNMLSLRHGQFIRYYQDTECREWKAAHA